MNWLKRNPLIFLVRTAWTEAKGQRCGLVFYVLLSAAALGVSLLEPLVIGALMNALQRQAAAAALLQEVLGYLGLFVTITLLSWGLHGPARIIERKLAFTIRSRFQLKVFRQVVALPVEWHKEHRCGAVIDRSSRATNALFDFCDSSFDIIQSSVQLIGSLIILCFIMPQAGAAMLLATGAALLATAAFDRFLETQYQELNVKFHHVAQALQEYLANVVTVISLRLEEGAAREVVRRLDSIIPLFRKNVVLIELKWFMLSVLVALSMAGILGWYCWAELSAGRMIMAGTFFSLFQYLRQITESFYNFADRYGTVTAQAANVHAVDLILKTDAEGTLATAHLCLPPGWKDLRISGLSYGHKRSALRAEVLKGVALRLRRGRACALVGESGSGKSTLLALLRGLRKAKSVEVLCDGQPIFGKLGPVGLTTTLIPQDPEIFADTVRFNICFGLEISDEAILEVLALARFTPVLERLPRGLDTNLSERDVCLSGGEKQRLALARGVFFARASEIVLLDEPTSSVDLVNERLIYQALLRHFKEQCVVSAVHRFHLLPLFDEILVFSGGRIVEQGDYQQLLNRRGKFFRLWQEQLVNNGDHEGPGGSGDQLIA